MEDANEKPAKTAPIPAKQLQMLVLSSYGWILAEGTSQIGI